MTGFGSTCTDITADYRLCCDIRTLNHKYLDVSVSLPRTLKTYESHILKQVKSVFHRGRIEVALYIEMNEISEPQLKINKQKARSYAEQLEALKKELSLAGEVDISLVAGFKDIFMNADLSDVPAETTLTSITSLLDDAIEKVSVMRKTEGKAIYHDFIERIAHLKSGLEQIRGEAAENVSLWRNKLRERIKEFAGDISIDENRMEQEILYHALKSDITEECVRLETHLTQFEQLLSAEGTFGKKLLFLLHEMTREVNTLNAKTVNTLTVARAVSLRDEIEHLREQIYNIE